MYKMGPNTRRKLLKRCFRKIQKSFCDDACVERFLKARGNDVKKAAKQLRTCLAWRDTIPIGKYFVITLEFNNRTYVSVFQSIVNLQQKC